MGFLPRVPVVERYALETAKSLFSAFLYLKSGELLGPKVLKRNEEYKNVFSKNENINIIITIIMSTRSVVGARGSVIA
jgi:hypothetical protein